jgi:hypothetical protein
MKLTGSAMSKQPRPPQLIPVLGGQENVKQEAREVQQTTPHHRSSGGPLCLMVLLAIACGPSKVDVSRIIERGAPLVKAIQAYEADTGKPPASLQVLVPRYLVAIPTTGLDASPDYRYDVNQEPRRWRLSVRMEKLGFKHMRFDPSRQYEIPVAELSGGWVMVTP